MSYNVFMSIKNNQSLTPKRFYTISLRVTESERAEIDAFFEENPHYNKASFIKMIIYNEIRERKGGSICEK